MVVSEGAGAIYLERSEAPEIELAQVTAAFPYGNDCSPEAAAQQMRDALPSDASGAMDFYDAPNGSEGVATREVLGFGVGAATAWQSVLAYEALASGRCQQAKVLGIGTDQQAIGAHIRKN